MIDGNKNRTDTEVGAGEESNSGNGDGTGFKTTVGTGAGQEIEDGNGDISGTETGTGEIGSENENTSNCNYCPEPYGEFPHPSECRKWVHCSHGMPYIKDCPSDLHFNPRLRVCDYQDRAGCVPSDVVCNPPNIVRRFIRL